MRDLDDTKLQKNEKNIDERTNDNRKERTEDERANDSRREQEKIGRMKNVEIEKETREILSKDSKSKLSDRDRCILERESKIINSKREELRQTQIHLIEKIKSNSQIKGDMKRLRDSDREMISKNNLYNQIEDRLHPERTEQKSKQSFNEKFRDCISRVEKESVHISEDKIYAKSTALDSARDSNKNAVTLALDICKYRAYTGRDIANETKTEMSRFKIKHLDEKNVDKFELDKIAISRNPDAIRNFYEFGLRVNDEKLKPDQINNAIILCKQLPKNNYQAKIEVIDRLVAGRIQNTKLDDEKLDKLVEKLDRIGREKAKSIEVEKNVKETIEREDLNKEKIDLLKEELLKEPKKFEENAVKLLINNKVDISDLKSAQKEADKIIERDPYEITKEDLRAMLIKNPENVLSLEELSIGLPDKLEIKNKTMYNSAINLLKEMNEKDNIIKLTVLSTVIKDPNSSDIKLGNKEEKQKIRELLISDCTGVKDIREAIKNSREYLRQEREGRSKENPKLEIIRLDSKQASREICSYVKLMCDKDDYNRLDVLKSLNTAKDDIKKNNIDIRSLDTKDKCLRDDELVKITTKDPQLLVNLQRMGIHLTRNGDINEEKLQERIDLIKEIKKDDAVLKMAVLSTCMVRYSSAKDNRITINNPVNLMDSEKNREVKTLAMSIVADEKHINFNRDEKTNLRLQEIKHAKEKLEITKRDEKLEKLHLDSLKNTNQKNLENISIFSLRDEDKLKRLSINPSLTNDEKEQLLEKYNKKLNKELLDLKNQSIDYMASNLIYIDKYEDLLKDISKSYEKNSNNPNVIGELKSSDLDKISKMTQPKFADEKSIFTYNDKNNEKMDATSRFIVLSACSDSLRLPFDGLSKTAQNKLIIEKNNFQNYLMDLTGKRNPLDKQVPPELVREYFNNKTYGVDIKDISEPKDIESLPIQKQYAAKAMFLDSLELLKDNEVLYNDKYCYIKKNSQVNLEINELYETVYNQFSTMKDFTIDGIKSEMTKSDSLKEKYKDIPEKYQKDENDRMVDDRRYNIRALSSIKSLNLSMITDASRFDSITSIADELYNAGFNCRYEYPTMGNDSYISIGNINTYSVSALNEDNYNNLRELIKEYDSDRLVEFDSLRNTESDMIKEMNLLIREFSDYERFVDDSYRNNSNNNAFEKSYEKYAEIRLNLDKRIEDITDSKLKSDFYDKKCVSQDECKVISNDLFEYKNDFLNTYKGYEKRYQEELTLSSLIEAEKLEKDSHLTPDGIDLSILSERNIDNAPYWTASDMLSYNNNRFEETNLLQEYYESILDAQNDIKSEMESYGLEYFIPVYDFKTDSVQILDPTDGNSKIFEYRNAEDGEISNGDFSRSEVIDIENKNFARTLYEKISEIKQEKIEELNTMIEDKNQFIVNSSIFEHGTDEIKEYIDTPYADDNSENDEIKFSTSSILTAIEELKEIEERTINDNLIRQDIESNISAIISEDSITEYLYSLII